MGIEFKAARTALERVWSNNDAKAEVLAALQSMDEGTLRPRNLKNFKGFESLTEGKFTKTRMLIQKGEEGKPDMIRAIFLRDDMAKVERSFKSKYK